MRFVISGYYGFDNSGDDALLLSIINSIKNRYVDADITVLSKKPESTKKLYNVDAIYRYNIFKIIYSLAKSDILISGGGTLIQDATSTKSLMYYLAIIKAAKILKKKVMLYANGIGPLTVFSNIEKTKNILNTVDLITIRDEKSFKELEHIGVNKPKIELTADPAFLLEPNENGTKILESYDVLQNAKYLFVSVRKWKNSPENFEQIIADFCDYAFEKYGLYSVIFPMQNKIDFEISAEIKNKMKNRSTLIGAKYPVESILSIMKEMHICLGMRLHTLIYSSSRTVPTIGLVYDPKVSGFMEDMDNGKFLNVEKLNREELFQLLDELMTNYDWEKSHIKFNLRDIHKRAENNIELLDKLLYGGNNERI